MGTLLTPSTSYTYPAGRIMLKSSKMALTASYMAIKCRQALLNGNEAEVEKENPSLM